MNTYHPETGQWTTDADRYHAVVDSDPDYRALADDVHDEPERAWPVLLRLISELDDETRGHAGAGPLQSFVWANAAAFIGRIEARARADDAFRRCLAEVELTDGQLPPDVQQRLVAASGGRIHVYPAEIDHDDGVR
ncbi:MAG TPA: hypothetical protein VFJ82_02345 [Longimicrobium sp.]|nr:hypothetical protein [Longimicrobium sp.]